MKKTLILFLVLISSSCTIIPSFSGAVDPTVLDPVSGLLFERTGDLSYIFFSKEQYVLIENKNHSVNSYYKLLNGEVYRDDVVTYQLDGWGSYDKQFIGLYIETEENPQITEEKPFPDTKLGITLQNSRALAINATKNLGSSSSRRDVTLGTKLQSSALYTLKALSPVVKTSAAGIFKPDENTFLSIKDLTPEGNTHAVLVKSKKDKTTGALVSTEHALTYSTPQTVLDSSVVYHYNADGVLYVIGVKFDLDFDSEFPRVQIIERTTPTDQLVAGVANLELELSTVTTWEYGFFSFLRVLDNSLDNFKDTLFVEFISENLSSRYNPLSTSRWFINSVEDSIRISTTSKNVYTEEDYLIGPTSQAGVFELIDFRNNDEIQTYSGKFFNIINAKDANENDIIVAKIANTADSFDKAILTNKLRKIDVMTPWPIELKNKTTIDSPKLGALPDGTTAIPGRSGFQAYVDSDTDTIHLIGGYTNSGVFPSGIPRIHEADTSTLQKIYNDIWSIKGMAEGNPVYEDTGLKLLTTGGGVPLPAFQQIVGAVTKKTLARPNQIFWAYGAGADSVSSTTINTDKFSYKNSANTAWDTFTIRTDYFGGIYHSAMVAHNNTLYIMGGTYSGDSIKNATGNLEVPGDFRNEIYMTSTLNTVTSSSWRVLRKSTIAGPTIWSPRVHSRVFSIGKTMILVGGIDGGNTVVLNPTPVNDVWISEDNGTNWNQTNTGGAPATAPEIPGPPPKQATIHDGPLIGTVHGGIIYLLDPSTRNVYYSPNKGVDWFKSPIGFEIDGSTPLYGAQLVAIKDELILIGGQTKNGETPGVAGDMETKIYKLKIASKG